MRVRFPELSEFDLAVRSAKAAIASSQAQPRLARVREELRPLAGSHLVDGWSSFDRTVLVFDNGRVLSVFLDGFSTEWRLTGTTPAKDNGVLTSPMEYCFAGKQSEPLTWDPTELINARRGRMLYNIWAGPLYLKLYFEGCPILNFMAMCNDETGQLFLKSSDWD